ncbi:hypothetical protein PLICRDRAFT_33412 [Plicaturopsis crispa FD-325 SS-3]|nr:hypothetical protein PLICRDRAFT_33412 [Plicaturopsis crispa FD-325 SS-3]
MPVDVLPVYRIRGAGECIEAPNIPVSLISQDRRNSRAALAKPTQNMASRKRPHCHTCGSPMAGHRRQSGIPICPVATHPTPYPSPRRESVPLPPPVDLFLHPSGRRVNPNWHSPRPSAHPVSQLAVEEYLIPTEPAYDGDSQAALIPGFNAPLKRDSASALDNALDRDRDTDVETASAASVTSSVFVRRILRRAVPLASVVDVPAADVARVKYAANKLGLHASTLSRPESRGQSTAPSRGPTDEARWMVLGKSALVVGHLKKLQQLARKGRKQGGEERKEPQGSVLEAMPGMLAPPTDGWASVGLLQLVLAGAVGGLVCAYGLSFW